LTSVEAVERLPERAALAGVSDAGPRRRPRRRLTWVGAGVAAAAVTIAVVAPGGGGSTSRVYAEAFQTDRPTLAGARLGQVLTWRVDGGTFAVQAGSANGVASGQTPAFATVAFRPGLRVFSTNYIHVESGSGIAFRYADANNYWSVVASQQFGTWNISKTVQGQTSFVANTGNNLYQNDTEVGLQFAGNEVTVVIDGKPSMRIADTTLAHASRVGLLSAPIDQGRTRWSRVDATT